MDSQPNVRPYASVWRRITAYLIDYAILFAVLVPLQGILAFVSNGFPYNLLKTGLQIELWVLLSVSLPVWLYFAISEQSSRKATLGKRIFRLQVTSMSGDRIGFGRAILRTVIKLLPWELTHITLLLPVPLWWDPAPGLRFGIIVVYVLIGIYLVTMFLNRRRQSIHDLLVKTVVVEIGKS